LIEDQITLLWRPKGTDPVEREAKQIIMDGEIRGLKDCPRMKYLRGDNRSKAG